MDVSTLEAKREQIQKIVCEGVKIASFVMQVSSDAFIGIDDNISADYVRKTLEIFLYHPMQPTDGANKDKGEASFIFSDVMTKCVDRICKRDAFGIFESPKHYLACFNTMCLDVA